MNPPRHVAIAANVLNCDKLVVEYAFNVAIAPDELLFSAH